jgi:hypothetical protein
MEQFFTELLRANLAEKQSNGHQLLTLQQVRLVDDRGQLRVTYPSRTDLQQSSISVERLFPSENIEKN